MRRFYRADRRVADGCDHTRSAPSCTPRRARTTGASQGGCTRGSRRRPPWCPLPAQRSRRSGLPRSGMIAAGPSPGLRHSRVRSGAEPWFRASTTTPSVPESSRLQSGSDLYGRAGFHPGAMAGPEREGLRGKPCCSAQPAQRTAPLPRLGGRLLVATDSGTTPPPGAYEGRGVAIMGDAESFPSSVQPGRGRHASGSACMTRTTPVATISSAPATGTRRGASRPPMLTRRNRWRA